MGLVDKLTEVDEKIWHGFEKVTQYCNREYGWDKYDLARKANKGMLVSGVGAGFYSTLEGYLGSSPTYYAYAAIISTVMALSYGGFERILKHKEEVELKRLEHSSAMPAPNFVSWRPLFYGFFTLKNIAEAAYSFLGYKSVPESITLPWEQYNFLEGLHNTCMASIFFFIASVSYFGDQIMTPPKKKKKVLKTLLEKAREKVEVEAVPQLEPVKPTKYQSIDEMVTGD